MKKGKYPTRIASFPLIKGGFAFWYFEHVRLNLNALFMFRNLVLNDYIVIGIKTKSIILHLQKFRNNQLFFLA